MSEKTSTQSRGQSSPQSETMLTVEQPPLPGSNADTSASPYTSAPPVGLVVFWGSCALVMLGFWVTHPLSALLLAFIVPVFYGAHEALHDTLIPQRGDASVARNAHNTLALFVGFGLQTMNFKLLRPGHMQHHIFGRYDEGYAPDVVPGAPRPMQRLHFYLTLLGLPALMWQMAGFASLFTPPKRLRFDAAIRFDAERSRVPNAVAQLAPILFVAYALWAGGWRKFLVFEVAFCFVWSVLQNVSHYGLRGIDPQTDRVCARTYLLEAPFRLLTFGSTSHLAHHVDMHLPGPYLHHPEVLALIEERLGVQIEVKQGILSFIADVARQFRGPVPEPQLNTSWIRAVERERPPVNRTAGGFRTRRGRRWQLNVSTGDRNETDETIAH